jgi:hypothetical protein
MKLRTTLLATGAAFIAALLAANAQVPGINSTLNSVFTLAYDNSTMKPTYSATSNITLASATQDFCLLTGSATKTVKVRRVALSGIASAVVSDPVYIMKRSTVPTSGTGTKPTIGPYDSTNSLTGSTSNAATAVAEVFTANPTSGTLVAEIASRYFTFGNLSTGVGALTEFAFGDLGSPIVLRGITQSVAVNLAGLTFASAQVSCTFEWTEE